MRYIRFFALGLTDFFIAILQAVIGTRNRMVFIGRYIAEKSWTHFSLLKKNGFIVTLHAKVYQTPTRLHSSSETVPHWLADFGPQFQNRNHRGRTAGTVWRFLSKSVCLFWASDEMLSPDCLTNRKIMTKREMRQYKILIAKQIAPLAGTITSWLKIYYAGTAVCIHQ